MKVFIAKIITALLAPSANHLGTMDAAGKVKF